MKKRILLTLCLAYSFFTYAQQVDYETAKTIASSFISQKKGSIHKNIAAISHQHTLLGETKNPLLFIFNFEDDGFVIVSADKNIEPILAYSTTGSFLMDGLNPAAEMWINVYAEGISNAVESKAVPASDILNSWDAAEKGLFSTKVQKEAIVEPLLTSKWNQDRYYNTLCPDADMPNWMASYDDHVPNGCVAVAMGQIMYYHRYPRSGIGASAYMSANHGAQTANYATANYNYESMSDVAVGYSNAIALLCYHAGVSVKMNYGANASGAFSEDVYVALASRFAYKSSLVIHNRSANDLAWKNLLKTDLNQGLPVYYSACGNTGLHGCHAFVCDGYDDNDFFHINWGWGGIADGYFSISTMNGYTLNNQIITGIEPFRENTISTGGDTLTATYGSFSDGSPARINYAYNTNRSWLIAPQQGKNITQIALKTAYFAIDATKDTVIIYSGSEANPDSVVAVLSGSLGDTTFIVDASQCLVTFASKSSVTCKGFKFTYTCTKTSDNLCPPQIPTPATIYEQPQGSITNNENGEFYEDENTCYWAIKPQGYQQISLHFTKFDLEEGDFVELYTWDGAVGLGTVKYWSHGKYRFTKQNPPDLNKEYLIASAGTYIRFRTDNNLNASGFELNWNKALAVTESQLGMASVHVFPNPAKDILKIEIESNLPESIQLTMSDMLGRTVYTSEHPALQQQYQKEIDVSSCSKGIYFLKISTSKGSMIRKIVIQ